MSLVGKLGNSLMSSYWCAVRSEPHATRLSWSAGTIEPAIRLMPEAGESPQHAELLASLLIFRILYFVAPFAVAVLMLGTRELWLARRVRSP